MRGTNQQQQMCGAKIGCTLPQAWNQSKFKMVQIIWQPAITPSPAIQTSHIFLQEPNSTAFGHGSIDQSFHGSTSHTENSDVVTGERPSNKQLSCCAWCSRMRWRNCAGCCSKALVTTTRRAAAVMVTRQPLWNECSASSVPSDYRNNMKQLV